MNTSVKIILAIWGLGGLLLFLLSTSFLTNWSEQALVNGATGLILGGMGVLGAYLGRTGTGRAIGFAVLFSVLGAATLTLFFSVIWPML